MHYVVISKREELLTEEQLIEWARTEYQELGADAVEGFNNVNLNSLPMAIWFLLKIGVLGLYKHI